MEDVQVGLLIIFERRCLSFPVAGISEEAQMMCVRCGHLRDMGTVALLNISPLNLSRTVPLISGARGLGALPSSAGRGAGSPAARAASRSAAGRRAGPRRGGPAFGESASQLRRRRHVDKPNGGHLVVAVSPSLGHVRFRCEERAR